MKFITALTLLASIAAATPIAIPPELQERDVCPDPFSVCQYAEDDGTCTIGYEGCIKKMGCNLCVGGEADCLGCASGCTIC